MTSPYAHMPLDERIRHVARQEAEASVDRIVEGVTDRLKDLLNVFVHPKAVENAKNVQGIGGRAFEDDTVPPAARPSQDEGRPTAVDKLALVEGAVFELDAVNVDALVPEVAVFNNRWVVQGFIPSVSRRKLTLAGSGKGSNPLPVDGAA